MTSKENIMLEIADDFMKFEIYVSSTIDLSDGLNIMIVGVHHRNMDLGSFSVYCGLDDVFFNKVVREIVLDKVVNFLESNLLA